ncbi:MAG: hypothetical protein HZC02_02025 [Candidatus Levybacteria bacterium]|nr:hypothetical protein [Candidatus Levybacteria bacterium]
MRSGIGKDIEFSFEESVSFEGNSGPYLQYTYVRTKSILEKSKTKNQKSKIDVSLSEARGTALEFEERQILVYLSRYNEIISEAAESFSPNIVTTYLFELAQLFNLFYQKYPILKADEDLKNFRLALTRSVGIIFKEGLHVLGIQAPERM